MFSWKTLASHELFHMCIIQTISSEIDVFRKCSWEGGASELSCQAWRHFKEQRLELGGSVLFSPTVLAIAASCCFSSYTVAEQFWKSQRCVVRIPQHMSPVLKCIWRPFSGLLDPKALMALVSALSFHSPLPVLLQPHRLPYSSSHLSSLYA